MFIYVIVIRNEIKSKNIMINIELYVYIAIGIIAIGFIGIGFGLAITLYRSQKRDFKNKYSLKQTKL